MKIWPFDEYAESSNGTRIAPADLKRALAPFEKIRRAVGDDMDIHVEFHSLWDLPTAIEIAQALAPYRPYWFEDPIKMTNLEALADYRRRTNVRVTASETLGTRWAFRELFDRQAVSVAMLDIAWCGGISEAKKIATMAEAYHLPIAPHDCTGPVVLTASVHLALNSPERARPGSGPGLLFRLVPGARHRAAAARARVHHRPGGPGTGRRPRAGSRPPSRRDRQGHPGVAITIQGGKTLRGAPSAMPSASVSLQPPRR